MTTLSTCPFISAATRCTWPRQGNTRKIVSPPPVPWIEFISATRIPAAQSRSPASPCASRKSAPHGQTWCSQVGPAQKNWRKRPSSPPPTKEVHEQGTPVIHYVVKKKVGSATPSGPSKPLAAGLRPGEQIRKDAVKGSPNLLSSLSGITIEHEHHCNFGRF